MTKTAILALIALFLSDIYIGIMKGWGLNPFVSASYHFLGGFFVAMLVFSFYHSEFKKLPQHLRVFVIVALTMAVGVTWEFAEYIGNKLLTEPIYQAYDFHFYFMGDLDDTVADLLMDALGAIIFVGFSSLNLLKRSKAQKS